jgi:bHLH factor
MSTKRDSEDVQGAELKKQKLDETTDLFLNDKAKTQDPSVSNENIDSELLNHRDESFDTNEYADTTAEHHGSNPANTESPAETTAVVTGDPVETDKTDKTDKIVRSSHQILHNNPDKPMAGSEEWHRIRKDNHKEVERRRRENINSGIKELAALLPSPETNKSQILQRAIEYIKRLKENEQNNIEKWTLEKLLNDQALAELTASNEKLKTELERAYREVEHWKKVCSIAKEEK